MKHSTMADFAEKSTTKKKRKVKRSEEKQRPPKTRRIDHSQERREPEEVAADGEEEKTEQRESNVNFEEGCPWRNLQLILSIRNKEIDIETKVQLAYDFIKLERNEVGNYSNHGFETVSISRLIVFLNDWVQSLLISSDKKSRVDGERLQSEVIAACFDFRCWEIFRFCLEASLKLHLSLNFSRNLLRAVGVISRNALSLLNDISLHSKETFFVGEGFELYAVVPDCVSLVFSSHSGMLNENLDLWISTVETVLELVRKLYCDNIDYCNVRDFILRFSCLVLEPFSKFLRVRPCRKSGFHDFIDKLLEPLLNVLGMLHLQIDGSNPDGSINLLKLVEEVLSQGLFHSVHIDGFLSLRSTEKYATSLDGKSKDSKAIIKSYHRHLFDKLEKVLAAKDFSVLGGLGELFRLLVHQVKKQKRASMHSEGTTMIGKTGDFFGHMSKMSLGNISVLSEKSYSSNSFSAEIRKSLFDFFVQIMEPLLLELDSLCQAALEVESVLEDVHSTLRSANNIISIFMHEKIYVRTEDTSDGACLNFLKKVYDIVSSYSIKMIQRWMPTYDKDKRMHEKMVIIAKELIVAVGYFLEIEYEVLGNDLVNLWLMVLSFFSLGHYMVDASDHCSLNSKILDLGYQLIKLYNDLRQVNNIIIALCKAVRIYVSRNNDGEINSSRYLSHTTSLSYEAYAKSVGMLVCSPKFRLVICNAVKAIPEGQASGCIQQLAMDISESLEWMKACCSVVAKKELESVCLRSCSLTFLDLQLEVLGRYLSEIYTLVLDSLTVTAGNSTLVVNSMNDLITVIRPSMSSLVRQHADSVTEFLLSVTGRTYNNKVDECKNDLIKTGGSTHWIFLFFFRLYMSCRSLYRQAISLLPPISSRKMSAVVGDLTTAYSGRDWMESSDWTDKGYFSWIVQPSSSLLIIIQSVSDIYVPEKIIDCSPLIYVLHSMALQRLVDLNRQIKSFEYILERNEKLDQPKLIDEDGLPPINRRSEKWECISALRQEALGLTEFILGFLSLVVKKQQSTFSSDDATYKDICSQALREDDAWDFGVCDVNESSLPTAIWWIVCQNTDIWCAHAAKKKLKMFLSLLIRSSLPCIEVRKLNINKLDHLRVTVQQISSELFSDTMLYEQRFVRRYMAPRLCRILEKSVSSLFRDSSHEDFDFNLLPNWSEVLCALNKSSMIVAGNRNVTFDCSSAAQPNSHLPNKVLTLTSMEFSACHSVLSLLCWMPKEYLNSRSSSRFASFILNLERLVVGNLFNWHGASSSQNRYELFKLFVSCRRALKCVIVASCEEKMEAGHSSLVSLIFQGSFPILWLLKSVSLVAGLQHTFPEESVSQHKDMIFSLMDHTSYVLLMLSKDQFCLPVHFLVTAKKPCEGTLNSGVCHEQNNLIDFNSCLDASEDVDEWKSVILTAETLKEQAQSLLLSLKDTFCNGKTEAGIDVVNLNRVSSMVSCFQGFLWGLASAVSEVDTKDFDAKPKLLKWRCEPITKLNLCINVFADFIDFLLCTLLSKDGQWPRSISDAQNLPNVDWAASLLTDIDSSELQCLNKPFLQSLLNGDNPEAAFLLGQLFIASSAILRLNLQINCTPFWSSLVPIFISISQVLLFEFTNSVEVPPPLSIVCLDGVLKYLEELGHHFPATNPTLTRNVYAKLIDLHFRAIGKCISFQGKRATLASHETESTTKTLDGLQDSSEASLSHGPYCLDEFKSRLRMSFKVFIKKPSELHLLSAIQALERALVGAQEGCTMIYEISTGNADGGKVSSTVAAGVDCLDSVLEFVSGRKRLGMVKRHIQNLLAGLFNIILHLQSPVIFYEKVVHNKGDVHADPDPGSVILMCVEVLTRVSGKRALFQMDSFHVGQSLRIPAALFQDFHRLRLSEPASFISSTSMDNLDYDPVASMHSFVIDRRFSVELFAACCRLLYTAVKHHKSECEQGIALLEVSVSVLLQCLETVDADSSIRKGYFALEVQEGVKCASFLRRIYEEIRHQKDVFGRYCFQFLSNYIWIYSGYGPLKTGIRREIDEALRPGVYALIDTCSADDLQHLHTVFGEGPCRSMLSTLQHDYKLNFQYEGKV